MKQLLFASDLDGTLLNAAHETDEEILTGMQELARQNAAEIGRASCRERVLQVV